MKGFSIGAIIGFITIFGIFYFISLKGEAGQHAFEAPDSEKQAEKSSSSNDEKAFTMHKEPSVQGSASDLEGTAKWSDYKKRDPSSEEMKVNLRKVKDPLIEKKSDVLIEKRFEKKAIQIAGKGHPVEGFKHTNVNKGPYTVQVASNTDKVLSESLLETLKGQGFKGFIQPATVNEKQYYRVRLGPVADKKEALALRDQVSKVKGINGPILAND